MRSMRFHFIDLFFILSFWIFLTGGEPFLTEPLRLWLLQRPGVYRLGVCLISALAGMLFLLKFTKKNKENEPAGLAVAAASFFIESGWRGVILIFISSSCLWILSSIARHDSFSTGFDLAIFSQAVWNTLQGHALYSSIKGGINLLGDHFSPLLFIFTPFYAVWADTKCLLIIQALAAASSVFPIYLIARQFFPQSKWILIWPIAFVLYLPLVNSVRFEFHPEIAAIPLWFWAFWALIKNKDLLSSLFLGLALSSKENAALSVFAWGLYALVVLRKNRYGLFWMGFSAAYFLLVIYFVIPHFSGQAYFYLSGNFSAWKQDGVGALTKHIISVSSVIYLAKIFLPVLACSLFSPAVLLTLPALFQNLTARNEMVLSIGYQYTAFLTPFVFISAMDGIRRIKLRENLKIGAMLLSGLLMAGIPEYIVLQNVSDKITPHYAQIKKLFREIPDNASLRTHEVFAPHLARRKELHIYENNHPREGGRPEALESDYVALDQGLLGASSETVLAQIKSSGYQVSNELNGFVILKRVSKKS